MSAFATASRADVTTEQLPKASASSYALDGVRLYNTNGEVRFPFLTRFPHMALYCRVSHCTLVIGEVIRITYLAHIAQAQVSYPGSRLCTDHDECISSRMSLRNDEVSDRGK